MVSLINQVKKNTSRVIMKNELKRRYLSVLSGW